MSPSKQHHHHHHQKNKNLSSSANSTTSNSTSTSSSPTKNPTPKKTGTAEATAPTTTTTTSPTTATTNSSNNNSQQQQPSTLTSASKLSTQQPQQQQQQSSPSPLSPSLPAQNNTPWSTSNSASINLPHPNHTAPSTSSSSPTNNPHNSYSTSSTKSHHHHNHHSHHHHHQHHSGPHREPRPSNSNRRASSNTTTTTTPTTTTALRHQHQQAQARAHAQVQAQLQAVQAHQLSYYQQHMADLATYITQVFLPSVLPTPEEYQIKEQTRQYLETLADRISKGARLLPFGSIASGLALRNSDMDLCYLAEPGNKIDNKSEKEGSGDPNTTESSSSSSLDTKETDVKPTPSSTPPTDDGSSSVPPVTSNQKTDLPEEEDKEQKPKPTPAEMVMILGKLIQEETAFTVKMLPKARIPIIKLSLPPSLGQPFGLSCDIGFENRLALENTRLLLTYAMVDPRMRTMVLFLKVWSKRRRINDPYLGTLSSYGYVLMVIYYLVNGRKAPVLPNLQQLPPPRVTPPEDTVYEGHDIYFFDDLDALPRFWVGMNRENVGELLIEFFRFFSSSFRYTHDVISVRTPGGLLSKESKGWMHDIIEESKDGRGGFLKIDLNRLCIEDPFQTNYNVARTVTRDGLFTIRGEFMRAVRVLSTRTDRLDVMIRELCEERQEGVLMAPPSSSGRRKSAPNPKASLNMSVSGSTTREEEEEEDDLEEQLLLQQQQQALLSAEHQPSYPPLTTRLMQDHIYSQATSSMDARPRYPPESIASEPPPLDRDLDWNHESISGYLSNEIQQLQLQQQQLQQPPSNNPQSLSHPAPHVSDTFKPSKSTTSAAPAGAQHYFHRFFQTSGTENWNPQASTSNSLHQSSMTSSPAFLYDSESLDPGLPLSPTSIPKHSSGGRRQKAAASDMNRDDIGSNSRGLHASTSSSSKSRYNSQAINSGRPPRSMSHSTMNPRRRSEQPQSSHQSLLNSTGPPIIMSSNGRMPDFSLLPLPGPIRFGNFGTTERLPKQKFDNPQRVLGRSVPSGYYHQTNGYPSTSFQQQDLSSHQMMSLPQDMISSQRPDGTSEDQPASQRAYQTSWQSHDPQREGMFLAAVNESARKRSLSNGATSTHSSTISFDQLSKPRSSLLENEEENRPGVETPRARSSHSPTCVGGQSTRMRESSEHSRNRDTSTPSFARCVPSTSSLSQLPRKIVFGDVEVSTETAKEVRVKALAAVLRTRRMGSLNSHSSRRAEGAANVLSSGSTNTGNNSPRSLEGRSRAARTASELSTHATSAKTELIHSSRSSSARSSQPSQKGPSKVSTPIEGDSSVPVSIGEQQSKNVGSVGRSTPVEAQDRTGLSQSTNLAPQAAVDRELCSRRNSSGSGSSRSANHSKDRQKRSPRTLPSSEDRPDTVLPSPPVRLVDSDFPPLNDQGPKVRTSTLPAGSGLSGLYSGSPPPPSSSVSTDPVLPQLDHPVL
ncbi:uncharacterized protein PGTG_04877 [Puccinia graminis f. sp. tritici CRL 75-36-700-3]|uniref:polynucleotide adenylyltransferase n=1 Tax=Puccinia graminis f. sp. tritici (strain CRL 75-36-700-3 / race SCCL) TaxID=418459 RepID=E3K364_PUCGT|nr:uncharacterized protein PGTG_04877 [Puccinia graminis f. sp. tritici CRL 75-36-700-3]EFP78921.2 hypothetical protein PGTG_04877 [Puccinia graminis f. sp. tritici CRL 75-36-700-3]